MASKRINVKAILADADLRRKLMVSTIQATQAREGIETSPEQADRAYYVVTEGERIAFFDLERFRAVRGQPERRWEMFLRSLRDEDGSIRRDVARRDFAFIEGNPLAYRSIAWLAPLFRDHPPLDPTYGVTRSGLNTTEIDRFARQRWEVEAPSVSHRWVLFAKGGDYGRFYTDWDLVIDWTDDGSEFKGVVASKYGSASRFVKSEDDYFREGVTWMQTTNLGINARRLPASGVFGVASPTFFPHDNDDIDVFLALMNSALFDAIARSLATRNWGATAIGTIPVPPLSSRTKAALRAIATEVHDLKAAWDSGNELSRTFRSSWLTMSEHADEDSIGTRLDRLLHEESTREARCQTLYNRLNDEVYGAYGVSPSTRAVVEHTLGERPPEVLWPQMAGKTAEQKRMEHVWRLLSFVVRRVIESDDDGIVPFNSSTGETPLVERVRQELVALFPGRDESQLEVEIVNELKRSVKGYRKCASLDDWLANAYFGYHASLYKNRPIYWHISSAQGTVPFAFGALVHYHRFEKNRMAKLRASYVRDTIEELRRDVGLADKAGRSDDRIELQAKLEEVQALDKRLQQIQEGHHEGPEGGERDFRILTPWKEPSTRPHGWEPDLDDGVKENVAPLNRAGVLRVSGGAG
jgi:hypothetical protein